MCVCVCLCTSKFNAGAAGLEQQGWGETIQLEREKWNARTAWNFCAEEWDLVPPPRRLLHLLVAWCRRAEGVKCIRTLVLYKCATPTFYSRILTTHAPRCSRQYHFGENTVSRSVSREAAEALRVDQASLRGIAAKPFWVQHREELRVDFGVHICEERSRRGRAR